MKNSISKLAILLAAAFLVFACSKDDAFETETEVNSISKESFTEKHGELKYSKLGSKYSKTQARQILAQTMAVALSENRGLSKLIMEYASKKQNGDTEVLFLTIKDTKLRNGTLAELLQETYYKNFGEKIPRDFFSKELVKADPYCTFYVDGIYFENPELVNKPATVIYETAEIDDTKAEFYEGFSAKGERVKIKQFTKSDFILGIKQNERVILMNPRSFISVNGSSLKQILRLPKAVDPCDNLYSAINGMFQQYLVDGNPVLLVQINELTRLYRCICHGDCDDPDSDGDGVPDADDDCPDEAGPASNNGCPEVEPGCVAPQGCDRTNRTAKDEIYKFKFASCSAYSSTATVDILEGRREMRASITYAYYNSVANTAATQTILKAGSFSRSSLKNTNWIGSCTSTKWVTSRWETFTWDFCNNGDQAYIYWYEEDNPDTTASLTLGFTFKLGPVSIPLSFNIPFANENDPLGGSVVQYCDNANGSGSLYNTGNIKFYYRMKP